MRASVLFGLVDIQVLGFGRNTSQMGARCGTHDVIPSGHVDGTTRDDRLPRVLIATLLKGDGATGVETHSREVSDYLTQLGMECETVTSFSFLPFLAAVMFAPRRLLAPILPAASVAWYRWSHRLFLQMSLKHRMRGGSPAVIYAQCPVAADAALRARRGDNHKIVMAVHFHGSQADEWADRKVVSPRGSVYGGIRRLEQRVIPAVDGRVFVSDSARRGLAAAIGGIEQLPWTLIPNFLQDRELTAPSSDEPAADLVTVGSLEPHKNHRYILEVLAVAARAGHPYSLDVIGDGSLLHTLLDRAEALGVAPQVHFLGRHPDPRSLLPGHKVYVHSSIRETGPLAVIEAMSSGLPIIAPSVGEVPKILGDGCCGSIWPLDDPTAAAELLISVLSDPAGLARMSQASRHRFLHSYCTEEIAPRLIAFFRAVADGCGAPFECERGPRATDPGTVQPA